MKTEKLVMRFLAILAISFYVADCVANTSIIFVAPPISADNYYDAKKADLYDYYANFIDIVNSRHLSSNEYILALVDEYGEQQLLNRGVSELNIFKNTNYPIADIWIRDFGTIQVDDTLYKFLYRPNYLSLSDARYIDNKYRNWLDYHSITYVDVDIILDGGNFVYERNTKKVIVTTRILDDNPTYDKLAMIQYLKDTMNVNYVAIIEQDALETTGHSDGIVTFINDEVIGINNYSVTSQQTFYDQIVSELGSAFGSMQIVDLPYDPTNDMWLDFYSAKGVYTNILTTLHTHYAPGYTSPYDGETVAILSQYKANGVDIQPVDATNVAIMGGAVRCLTWYIWGVPAVEFIAQNNILSSVTPAPITPAPTTTAPITPAPTAPGPITPAPTTPAPITPAPTTPAPITPASTTPAPITPAPTTPVPSATSSVTPAPITTAPTTHVPSASVTPAPITPAPTTVTVADVSQTSTHSPALGSCAKKFNAKIVMCFVCLFLICIY